MIRDLTPEEAAEARREYGPDAITTREELLENFSEDELAEFEERCNRKVLAINKLFSWGS